MIVVGKKLIVSFLILKLKKKINCKRLIFYLY